ncbi:serine--tRNA ligase [Azospirillum sp. TSO35-2]|nr:serine--tRNA ligase [Azospirillum sp. TSO35-2]
MWTPHRPDGYARHPLHQGERIWPETNCYVDLWIEALHARGLDPLAMLGFTVTQDFEGDQFTFFKVPLEDLETLYGLRVQELAIYDSVEAHAAEQLRRTSDGGLVLVEVDGFHLPDTRGTSYGTTHVKTTVGIVRIDPAARWMDYFHNAGFYRLEGADYDGAFAAAAGPLFPYVEFVKTGRPPLEGRALVGASLDLMRRHLARRPAGNPVTAYRAAFPEHLDRLLARPMEDFHLYAFNLLRQLGANFELLGAHVGWLDGPAEAVEACRSIAEGAKAMQFQLARTVARRKAPDLTDSFDRLERAHDTALGALNRHYG